MRLSKPQKLIYDMEKYAGGSISVICGSMLLPGKKEIMKSGKLSISYIKQMQVCVFGIS